MNRKAAHLRVALAALGLAALAPSACSDDGTPVSTSTTGGDTETDTDTGTSAGTTATGTSEGPGTSSTGVDTTSSSTTDASTGTTEMGSSTTGVDLCADGVQSGDETDVDCGGDSCSPCGLGDACEIFSDCATQACVGHVCVDPECLGDDDCSALSDQCTKGVCLPNYTCAAYPDNEGSTCTSDNLCATSTACLDGFCIVTEVLDCSFLDGECTQGECNPDDGLCYTQLADDETPCDDGNGCTEGEMCNGGACIDPGGSGYLMYESFAFPNGQWQLGPLWEIGPAEESPNDLGFSGQDPGEDHTEGDDNGLAGVVIGGLDTIPFHGEYCLGSPIIDTSAEPGPVYLTFWRHLHSESLPTTINAVFAWDGQQWVELEQGYDAIVNDAEWKKISHDVTELKNAAFRFQICVRRLPGSANSASWSVDDVTVARTDCTP